MGEWVASEERYVLRMGDVEFSAMEGDPDSNEPPWMVWVTGHVSTRVFADTREEGLLLLLPKVRERSLMWKGIEDALTEMSGGPGTRLPLSKLWSGGLG